MTDQIDLVHLRQDLNITEAYIERKQYQIDEEDRLHRGRSSSSAYMAIYRTELRNAEGKARELRRQIEALGKKMTGRT